MSIKRISIALAAAAAAVLLVGSPAFAGNAHFIASQTSASLDGTDLVIEFKEAGLEAGTTVDLVAMADLSATYECRNNGGKTPSDPKKTDTDTVQNDTATFTVPKNGQLTDTMTLEAPEASTVLDCPKGQRATLTSVLWSNVTLTDVQNDASIRIPFP